MESVRLCLALRAGGIRGTTTQCSLDFKVFPGVSGWFFEKGMMCIVWRERFTSESRSLFIAGVRPSVMVMKAAPQSRSSVCVVAGWILPPVFVCKTAVFWRACGYPHSVSSPLRSKMSLMHKVFYLKRLMCCSWALCFKLVNVKMSHLHVAHL